MCVLGWRRGGGGMKHSRFGFWIKYQVPLLGYGYEYWVLWVRVDGESMFFFYFRGKEKTRRKNGRNELSHRLSIFHSQLGFV